MNTGPKPAGHTAEPLLLGNDVIKGQAHVVLFCRCVSDVGPGGAEEPPEHSQRHPHQQPEQEEREGHTDLHQVEDGCAEAAEDAGEEERSQSYAGIEREFGEHEGMLPASVAHVWVKRLALREECSDPHGQLEESCEENNDTTDLDGLQLVAGPARELVGQLVRQR